MTDAHTSAVKLLKTARGQLDGILRMIDDGRYCIDISTQIMAAQALLGRANAEILKAHISHCVHDAVLRGDADEKLDEIAAILEKLTKR